MTGNPGLGQCAKRRATSQRPMHEPGLATAYVPSHSCTSPTAATPVATRPRGPPLPLVSLGPPSPPPAGNPNPCLALGTLHRAPVGRHGRPGPSGFGLCGRLPKYGVGGFMFNSSSSSARSTHTAHALPRNARPSIWQMANGRTAGAMAGAVCGRRRATAGRLGARAGRRAALVAAARQTKQRSTRDDPRPFDPAVTYSGGTLISASPGWICSRPVANRSAE